MFKTKLQELCHKKGWSLPEYAMSRVAGLPDHMPQFHSTVTVNGQSFTSQGESGSSKLAQNDAAYLAFLHLSSPSSSSLPGSSAGEVLVDAVSNINDRVRSGGMLNAELPQLIQTNEIGGSAVAAISKNDDIYKGGGMLNAELPQLIQTNEIGGSVVAAISKNDDIYKGGGMFNTELPKVIQTQEISGSAAAAFPKNDEIFKEAPHVSKNHLQVYAQKNHLPLPTYSCERVGSPHCSRFKCKVTLNGQTYESPSFFSTVKEAESDAAKVALMSLPFDGVKEEDLSYKNLLQELAQREGYNLPTYTTSFHGQAHMPTFISTVEIDGQSFVGEESKSKKAAELSAAKVAYTAKKSRSLSETHNNPVSVSPLKEAFHGASSNLLPDANACPQQNVQEMEIPLPSETFERKGNCTQQNVQEMEIPLPSETVERKAMTEVASHQQVAVLAEHEPEIRTETASGLSLPEQNSSSSPTDSPSMSVINSSIEYLVKQSPLCHKGVVIHSRDTKVTYPEGSIRSSMSDENWIVTIYTP